jgi:hypothetical protein
MAASADILELREIRKVAASRADPVEFLNRPRKLERFLACDPKSP